MTSGPVKHFQRTIGKADWVENDNDDPYAREKWF